MEIVVTLDDTHEKELLVTAPWELVADDYDRLLKSYSKLPVRGFRPGKSPVSLVESAFAGQISNDLAAATSMRLCRKALKETGLVAGSPIEVSEIVLSKGEHLCFKAAFIVMPEFALPDYTHLALQAGDYDGKLDEISHKLLERTEIALHSSLIDNELNYSGGGEDNQQQRDDALARVKLMLILKKIALQDQIEIDEKDVEQRIRDVAAENGVTPDYLRQFLIGNGGMSRFTDSLLAEAVLDYIIEIQS